MAGQDTEKFSEIFDRLRETEAQTREQNERISNLCDRLDNFTTVTDKFFDLEEKRHEADEKRFLTLCDHEKRLSDKAAEREDKMWKIITILIGAVLAAAFGPKAVTEIYKTATGKQVPITQWSMPIICPLQEHHYADCIPSKSDKCV